MINTKPAVSVIIPAFNAEAYLKAAIRSVLAQTEQPLEVVVVVDNRSADHTLALAQSFSPPVRTLVAHQPGLAFARNLGNDSAHGAFVLHLDADDLLHTEALTKLLSCLAQAPQHQMAAGRLQCFSSPELSTEAALSYTIPATPQYGHLSGVALVRREAFHTYGPFDETYIVNSDLDWWVRALDQGASVCTIEDVVLHRRIHGANLSIQCSELLSQTQVKIVAASLRRRRQAEGRLTAATSARIPSVSA